MNETPQQPIFTHTISLRVRYCETDQMGTFYNSRALEWFECGRTELLRAAGVSYAKLEEDGFFLPVIEAFVRYLNKARYDDLLEVKTSMFMGGRARIKMQVDISHSESQKPVVSGYTIHIFTNRNGHPIKPPKFFYEIFGIKK
ncbi:MAG TPA: thioesterase family protein [Verrucomicrobiota bacterium]|nr:thioesterase family protein [Verrucomicrobiota bacterium]